MADTIRVVEYFYVETPNTPGVGAAMLATLRDARVNLLAFSGFPSGRRAQIDFVPEDAAAFRAAAKAAKWKLVGPKKAFLVSGADRPGAVAELMTKLAQAKINVTAVDALCARARAFGCETVMSPVDKGTGDVARAAASVREVGDIAARHGVRLAVEFNSQCEQLNTLEAVREVLAKAAHPRCGLLFDAYHMQRSGGSPRSLDDVRGDEIVYVQFSDVPRGELKRGEVLNRLPPGQGCVPFKEFFAAVAAKGYAGFMSYEAPNPAAWARSGRDVAREALAATRAVL